MSLFVANIVLSFVIGILGINRKLGFWGYFFASLLLTPFVGFLFVLVSDPRAPKKEIKKEK